MTLLANLVEHWTEYAIGVFICTLRLFTRIYLEGWRSLYYDDLFAFIAMCFWSSEAATIYVLNMHGTLVGLTNETVDALTDTQVKSLTIGSKARFYAWISYICMIWSLKASALFFYNRLSRGLKEQRLVKILGWCVGVSWVAMITQILLQCRPIHQNWQIKPYIGDSCTLSYARYYLLLALNVSTDICIMAFIPAPILWKAQIPIKRKLMVALLLFSGTFIVVAAIIRCVISINNIRHNTTSGVWGVRETFVSILAVNSPAIKPLLSSCHRRGGAVGSSVNSSSRAKYGGMINRRDASQKMRSQHTPHEADEIELRLGAQWSGKDQYSIRDVEWGSLGDEDPPEPKGSGLQIEVTKAFATSSERRVGPLEADGPQSWSSATGSVMHDITKVREA